MIKTGKIVSALLGVVGGVMAGFAAAVKLMGKHIALKEEKRVKFKTYYEVANEWLMLKNEGKSLEEYFVGNGCKTMAFTAGAS